MKSIITANDNITSNSKQVEVLKSHFPNCFDKHGAFIPAKLQEIVETSGVELSKEGYSLNWLGKSYARLLANENVRTLLNANLEHNSLPENANSQNMLIKGDNLEVLKHLMGAYAGKVKMIYIDPPYNTGSDGFVYQDDRKFTVEQLSHLAGIDEDEAKRILEFTDSGSNSHSAWLTFMYPRLYLAKQLLRDDGVIFISIDDNEQAQLKLLCDEVFGEENHLVNFYAQVRYADKTLAEKNDYQKLIEQVLAYKKCSLFKPIKPSDDYSIDGFCWEIKTIGDGEKTVLNNKNVTIFKDGEWTIAKVQPHVDGLKEVWATGTVLKANASGKFFGDYLAKRKEIDGLNCLYKVDGVGDDGIGYRYFTGAKKESATKGKFFSGLPLSRRVELDNGGAIKEKPINNFVDFSDAFGNCRHEGEVDFRGGKKPIAFIKNFIEHIATNDEIVLDFFAGSGSTAHAVMDFNANKNTHLKFITVQIDEETKEGSDTYQAGFKSIFDLTAQRIKRASVKIKEAHPEAQCDFGFKQFETIPVFEGYLDEPDELTPELELFNANKLSVEERHSLMLTWQAQDGIALNTNLTPLDLDGYTAYQGGRLVYFIEPELTLNAIVAFLERLDNDAAFIPNQLVVLGYLLDSKTQREMTEAVKQYNNRKGIELTLDVRF